MGYNKPYNKGIQRVVFHPLYNLNNEGYFSLHMYLLVFRRFVDIFVIFIYVTLPETNSKSTWK